MKEKIERLALEKKIELPAKRIDRHLKARGLFDPSLYIPRGNELEVACEAIESGRAPVFISGATSAGKTSTGTMVEHELHQKCPKLRWIRIATLPRSATELLLKIARGLKIPEYQMDVENGGMLGMLDVIEKRLLKADGPTVAYIDEGTDISLLSKDEKRDILKALKVLANLAGPDGRTLISIVMTGLPETLDEIGAESETLRARFEFCNITLPPLVPPTQVREYVDRYMGYAGVEPLVKVRGGRTVSMFDAGAIDEIYRQSGGLPGKINRILLDILQHMPESQTSIDEDFVKGATGAAEKAEEGAAYQDLTDNEAKIMKLMARVYGRGVTPLKEAALKMRDEKLIRPRDSDNPVPAASEALKRITRKGFLIRVEGPRGYDYKLSERACSVFLPRA